MAKAPRSGRGNLLRGGIQRHKRERAARESARLASVATREGVIEVLRGILADPDESGAYRTAAARLLLTPEGGSEPCRRCEAERALMEKGSVRDWIRGTVENDRREWYEGIKSRLAARPETEPPPCETCRRPFDRAYFDDAYHRNGGAPPEGGDDAA